MLKKLYLFLFLLLPLAASAQFSTGIPAGQKQPQAIIYKNLDSLFLYTGTANFKVASLGYVASLTKTNLTRFNTRLDSLKQVTAKLNESNTYNGSLNEFKNTTTVHTLNIGTAGQFNDQVPSFDFGQVHYDMGNGLSVSNKLSLFDNSSVKHTLWEIGGKLYFINNDGSSSGYIDQNSDIYNNRGRLLGTNDLTGYSASGTAPTQTRTNAGNDTTYQSKLYIINVYTYLKKTSTGVVDSISDQSAGLQAAANAAAAYGAGSVLALPSGKIVYGSTWAIKNQCIVKGQGGIRTYINESSANGRTGTGTRLVYTGTGRAIDVQSDRCEFSNFSLYQQNDNVSTSRGLRMSKGYGSRVHDLYIANFGINLDAANCLESSFYDIMLNNPVINDMYLADSVNADGGDNMVNRIWFYGGKYTGVTLFRQVGAGGTHFTDNKINVEGTGIRPLIGVDVDLTGTSQFLASNNSLENYTQIGYRITGGNGSKGVSITGGYMAPNGTITGNDIDIEGTNGGIMYGVDINTIIYDPTSTVTAIKLVNLNSVKVNTGQVTSGGVKVTASGVTYLDDRIANATYPLTDAATITIDPHNGTNQSVTLGGNRTLAFANHLRGNTGVLIVKQDATGSRTLTSSGSIVWADNYRINPAANSVTYLTYTIAQDFNIYLKAFSNYQYTATDNSTMQILSNMGTNAVDASWISNSNTITGAAVKNLLLSLSSGASDVIIKASTASPGTFFKANGTFGVGLATTFGWLNTGASTTLLSNLYFPAGVATQTTLKQGAVNFDGTRLYVGSGTTPVNQTVAYLSDVASVTPANVRTNAATLTLPTTNLTNYYSFTGTTSTWTLPTVAAGTNITYFVKNSGTGTLTINSNAGGTDIYYTSPLATISISTGNAIILHNDGVAWQVE